MNGADAAPRAEDVETLTQKRISGLGFHGLAGRIINDIAPYSEADPSGLLVQFLTAVGNAIGPSPFYRVEATRHHPNLFVCLVGDTAKARKGTSWGWIDTLVKQADPGWADCIRSGCVSGEGVIYHVRDSDEETLDRRLMIVESEFAQVLKVARREGNTLSPILRRAWDSDVLRTLAKNSPLTSTDAHISIVGHITRDELIRLFSETEIANGLGNRFLWVSVTRSKLLPHGRPYPQESISAFARDLSIVFAYARKGGTLVMDDLARQEWSRIYKDLSKCPSGMIGALTARAEAQIVRLSGIYALMDCTTTISTPHLRAAESVWKYCEMSVREIFGTVTGNRIADVIHAAVIQEGQVSRTAIRELGNRHWSRREVDDAIDILIEDFDFMVTTVDSGGRPSQFVSMRDKSD
jgi:hypothetical protein